MPPDLSGIQPVILCGGLGSRLYPLSTPEKPKPYLNLNSDDVSLLQETALRIKNAKNPVVICHEDHIDLTLQQLDEVNVKAEMLWVLVVQTETHEVFHIDSFTGVGALKLLSVWAYMLEPPCFW